VLASLVPIVVGVIIASATELEFNLAGLLSALASVMVAAGQTVFVKGVLKQREIDTLSLLLFTSEIALLGLGPVWWWVDGANLLSASTAGDETGDGLLWPQQKTALQWLACAGVLNTVQTISAFAYLNSVSPVSYVTPSCRCVCPCSLALDAPVDGRNRGNKKKKPPSNKEPSPLHRYAWAFAAVYTLHPERAHVPHRQGRARLMCVCGVFAFHFRFTISRRRTRRGSHFPSLTT
jgi:hypothetical protein